ncbi:GNAT family N-acetyltransferase [Iamia sp. SCSIO 61187]|uniref:GNAT family N-acetyltransferase n=1 Tax=Iamia sp. SCSIO 61187 TaxID=2722752 RepID=UPI001C626FEE|nr:GNAT family N-acetyltransferase [Iamia sp. SCSIO 61187]QYG93357.1 GNAT family N-acetyltransferase [Iamia sp. SCSIO 61187]
MATQPDPARELDEVAARATASPETHVVDGWAAKCAPGLPFRRCNSVLPPVGAGADPARAEAVIDRLAGWYDERGFRIAVVISTADPSAAALDRLLADRGWEVEAPVDMLVAPLADVGAASGAEEVTVEVAVGVDEAWARRYGAVHGDDDASRSRVEAYGRLLQDLGPGALAAVARRDGDLAGVGFSVVEGRWLGVFGMGTAPAHRRRGAARTVLCALAGAGLGAGATDAYLQVEVDNPGAQALYRGTGFTPSHAYHYRVSAPR